MYLWVLNKLTRGINLLHIDCKGGTNMCRLTAHTS